MGSSVGLEGQDSQISSMALTYCTGYAVMHKMEFGEAKLNKQPIVFDPVNS